MTLWWWQFSDVNVILITSIPTCVTNIDLFQVINLIEFQSWHFVIYHEEILFKIILSKTVNFQSSAYFLIYCDRVFLKLCSTHVFAKHFLGLLLLTYLFLHKKWPIYCWTSCRYLQNMNVKNKLLFTMLNNFCPMNIILCKIYWQQKHMLKLWATNLKIFFDYMCFAAIDKTMLSKLAKNLVDVRSFGLQTLDVSQNYLVHGLLTMAVSLQGFNENFLYIVTVENSCFGRC